MEHHQLLFFFQKKENKRSTYVDTCKGAKSLLQQKCVVLTESTNVPDKQTEEVTKKARRGGGGGGVECAKLTWRLLTHFLRDKNFRRRRQRTPPPLPHPSLSVSLLHPSAVFISEATPTPCSPPFLKLQTFPSASNQVRAPKTNRQPKYIFIWPTSSTCFQFNFHVPTRKNHRLTNTANVNRLQLAGDFILTKKKKRRVTNQRNASIAKLPPDWRRSSERRIPPSG